MAERPCVLLIDDERDLVESLQKVLNRKGFRVRVALCADEGLAALRADPPAVVVVDLRMPGPSGLDVIRRVHEHDEHLPVILISGSPGSLIESLQVEPGEYEYLPKPFSNRQLELAVTRALAYRRLIKDNRRLEDRVRQLEQRLRDTEGGDHGR